MRCGTAGKRVPGLPVAEAYARAVFIISTGFAKDAEEEKKLRQVKQAISDAPFLLVTSSHLPRRAEIFSAGRVRPLPAPARRWPSTRP